jgi:16S rRNA (adenine1518-N6/adenine1519-N6)-dimethyltransferase
VPKKRFGQHFLTDPGILARIVQFSRIGPEDHVVEIGPGRGALTTRLAEVARTVTAVEIDTDLTGPLIRAMPANVTIIQRDALEVDYRDISMPPYALVANLPYNIATALLVRWLAAEPWPPWYDRLVLMFQREVAERIVAAPGGKTYGRLSVLAGWRCRAKILFDINPSAFVPPPKVTSSLVELVPREAPLPCDRRLLERVTEAAFGQRRKMLRQSLKSLGTDPLPLLDAAGLAPTARAEDIAIEGFVALARALKANNA